jgi:peptidoglycan hydrolase FlgJ
MNTIQGAGAAGATPAAGGEDARLRSVARQMEGLFVEQLFKAMRETVPQDGVLHGGQGEEIFTGLMDQHLAGQVPARWDSDLSAAIYRQLAARSGSGGSHGQSPEAEG